MTESIAPKSDQLNAEDMLTGPRTFTIAEVKRGNDEQPIHIHLVEFPGRPWKPSKTSRRILVGGWGPDASTYSGRRVTLYRDPDIKFGGIAVGGIAVSHMSNLDKPLKLALTQTRGKRGMYVVQPLADAPALAPDRLAELRTKMADHGITAKADALGYLSATVGREVAASKDLTPDEVAQVIAQLDAPPPDALPVEDPPAGWDDVAVREVQP